MNYVIKPLIFFWNYGLRKNLFSLEMKLHFKTHWVSFTTTKTIAVICKRFFFRIVQTHCETLLFLNAVRKDFLYEGRQIPVSRTIAVIKEPGVTSNAGL